MTLWQSLLHALGLYHPSTTPVKPPTHALTFHVVMGDGSPVPAPLTIRVVDAAPNPLAGQVWQTNNNGDVTIQVQQAGFTVTVEAPSNLYLPVSQGITLTSDDTVNLTLPRAFPTAPTRDELCGGTIRFQGVTVQTSQFGTVPAFGPEVTSYNDADRLSHYTALQQAGATICEFAISWKYDEPSFHYPVPGCDLSNNLPRLGDLIIEAIQHGFKGVWLFMSGDGLSAPKNSDGSYPYNDPAGWTYGWQWLMEKTPSIVSFFKNYKGIDLTQYMVFIPGYDGCVPGWAGSENNWHRMNQWIALINQSGAPYIGIELSSGYPNWSGEGVTDYSSPEGQLLSLVLYETPAPMGPTNMPVPADFCNQSNDVRSPFDQVWQIFSRLLGTKYRRPSDQPSCDDPSVHPDLPTTPRGKIFVNAYEYETYRWVRNQVSAEQVQKERQYFASIGCEYIG